MGGCRRMVSYGEVPHMSLYIHALNIKHPPEPHQQTLRVSFWEMGPACKHMLQRSTLLHCAQQALPPPGLTAHHIKPRTAFCLLL